MDICVLNPYFYPYFGGTEKVLMEIYSRLAKKNNVTVLTSSVGSQVGEEEFKGIRIVRLKTSSRILPHLPLPYLAMNGLKEEIEKEDADIYHINNRYQYFKGTLKTIKSKPKGKLALTIHNSLPIGIDPITDFGGLAYDVFWGRHIMNAADLITAVSKNALDVTVPKSMEKKGLVIPNGIDLDRFKPNLENKEVMEIKNSLGFGTGLLLVSNGRLTGQKGHKYLIRSLKELNSKGIKANLLIIGAGPLEKKLEEMALKIGVSERLRIMSGIREEDLPFYYASADIFVFPSLYEPAGMAMLEALACGIPTIATHVGGIPETLKDYGEYIKVKDSNGITAAVMKVASDLKHYLDLSLECRKKVIEPEHTWDLIAKKYQDAFEKISVK